MTKPFIALGCCSLIFAASAPLVAAAPPSKPITSARKADDAPQPNNEKSVALLSPIASQWAGRVQLAPQRFELVNSAPLSIAGYVDAQRQLLAAQIKDASDPAKQMDARLTAANWELAAAAATPVSYILIGIDSPSHANQLRGLTQAATQLLDQVDEQLEAADQVPDDEADALSLKLMRLRAFAQILASLADSAEGKAEKSVNDMLTSTAILLEDSRADIVATAELYQGFMLGQSGRPERGLKILKLATAKVAPGTKPFAVMGKLVRLRLLNAAGMTDAAWALSLRLGEQLSDWVRSKPTLAETRAGLTLLRLDTMTQARDRAKIAGDEDEVKWIADRIQSLDAEWSSQDSQADGVLRLNLAVPMLSKIERRPTSRSLFDLQTAASTLAVVVDLSDAVTNAQRNTLLRQLETDLGKFGESDRLAILATCPTGPCFSADPKFAPAEPDLIQTAVKWLADRKPEKPSPLSAAIAEAMKLSPAQLMILTDRPYAAQWGDAVTKSAQNGKVDIDIVQIHSEEQAAPPATLFAPGVRVTPIKRQAPPKPAAPSPEEDTEPDEPQPSKPQAKTKIKPKEPSLTQSDDVDD